MPSQTKSRKQGLKTPLVLFWTCASVLALAFGYAKFSDGNRVPLDERRDTRVVGPSTGGKVAADSEKPRIARRDTVTVSKPVYDSNDLRYTSTNHPVKSNEDPYLVAINGFLEASHVVDQGAKAVSAHLEGSVLVINFSKPFERTYGTDDERTLIDGILHTVRQFNEVQAVRILVVGDRIDTLGNIDLNEDLQVTR